MRYCIYCGHSLNDKASFCSFCGKAQKNTKESSSFRYALVCIVTLVVGFFMYSAFFKFTPSNETVKASSHDGTIYKSTQVDKKRTKGNITFPNGGHYEGDLIDNSPNGYGIVVLPNGENYEGNWYNGKPSGKGITNWSNGNSYEGNFVNGLPNGIGIYTTPFNERYEGSWSNGKKHGRGVFTSPYGNYEGEWVNDKPNGNGVLTANGARYVGEVSDSLPNGYGTYYFPDGSVKKGRWLDDKYVGP